MKKNILLLFITLSSFFFYAQKKELTPQEEAIEIEGVEDIPIYPGCEKKDKALHKKCLEHKIKSLFIRNFNTKIAKALKLKPSSYATYVIFTINKKGIVSNIGAIGFHYKLEKEGVRVAKLLPKMKPGKNNGKVVAVKYTYPVIITIE